MKTDLSEPTPQRQSRVNRRDFIKAVTTAAGLTILTPSLLPGKVPHPDALEGSFADPPASARPWVYWYFMDGNMTREGMTADLEAMKQAGIGGAIFLEVDIGIPRGPVAFMSAEWQELFVHGIHEAERLGIQIALGTGPGWCGSGGPWIKPEQSMQDLVASETTLTGPAHFDAVLPQPKPRTPTFGVGSIGTPELTKEWEEFYVDVLVLAFPTPEGHSHIDDSDEKALYYRGSYSSNFTFAGGPCAPFIPAPADFPAAPPAQAIPAERVIDLSAHLDDQGRLVWDAPAGNWTILRFGRTTTGQTTRPAPHAGLGFESDKFDSDSLDTQYAAFIEPLLKAIGPRKTDGAGLTMLHFDSWEMGSQNWSEKFRQGFQKRRGYDPTPYLPAMLGRIVGSIEISERFLWDLRQTAQELVVENHAMYLREIAHNHGMGLSIEPYDLDPCADLYLGTAADVPQCEFWSQGFGWPIGAFSCIEATSIGHILGRPIIAAEAFTAGAGDAWHQYPGAMKPQTDWAFGAGINRFVIHRYQHQPWLDRFPGMTMGPYGVYWERTETWWDMASAYHTYLSRCQETLRFGLPVADILYLAAEGAPHVFLPPDSALQDEWPDRRSYNFDGCDPHVLMALASVKDGRVVFPGGASYGVLVLPEFDTMTPALLQKIKELLEAGATVIGGPPLKSPSLVDYPECDRQVQRLAAELWGSGPPAARRHIGKGLLVYDSQRYTPSDVSQIKDARWIWYPEGNPAASEPPCRRWFERRFEIPAGRPIESAQVRMTADNSFELQVNGHHAGSGDNFNEIVTMDVAAWLKPGPNILSVIADNSGDAPNPAGLIGRLDVVFRAGASITINTDRKWDSAQAEAGPWAPAMDLGAAPMAPWNLSHTRDHTPCIYPSYTATAQVLARMGVKPDFETDGSLRYTHRRSGATDIYFVANREDHASSAVCHFRVAGRQPEWWDALTGEQRPLPEFDDRNGITTIRLEFAPYQSAFIVFRRTFDARRSRTGRNFPKMATVNEISGPWEVSFDSKWGGPEKIIFDKLDDWTARPEDGIRHYSGKATYRKLFDLPNLADHHQSRLYITLGSVHAMASVKLNGHDIGIAWCEPWRLEIPAGILREHGNQLEITVANLWINRLIGDAALPEGKRLTWTTNRPYSKDSPLQPSGLHGPVTIQVTEG